MGASQAGPPTPDDAYEMSFTAGPNEVPGNERDSTPIGQGTPVDVTDRVFLCAGTEVDEEPRTGPNQVPRQQGLNTGPDGEGSVARVMDTDGDDRPDNDGFSYAPTREVIRVTTTSR